MGFVSYDNRYRKSPPDEQIPMDQKLKDGYGLALAKYIYEYPNQAPMFYNAKSEYAEYVQYALGRQDENKYKPLLRIKPNQADENWVGAIKWAVKNYATKRVNIAVSKVSRRVFDPIVEPIDKNAIDKKQFLRNKIKAYMDNRAFFQQMSAMVEQSFVPNEIDPALIPETVSELDLWMNTEFKFKESSYLEKGISHVCDRSRYDTLKRKIDFDVFVHGVGCSAVGMDENMIPFVSTPDISNLIVPATNKEDFSDIPFVGEIIYMTIPEFIKSAGAEFSKTELQEIIQRYSRKEPDKYTGSDVRARASQQYVPVMRFVYKTTDEIVKVKKKDKYGNTRFLDKNYNEYRTEREQQKFIEKYGNSRKLYRRTIYNILEGYWIIGSEAVFRYGLISNQIRPRGALSETLLPYKFFAPNIHDSKPVSTIKQMIPVLDELQSYHIKKQHVIASAIPAGLAIDLNGLRNAQFKWNNKNMSDQQKMRFFFQTGIFVHDPGQKYVAGSSNRPVYEIKSSQLSEVETYLRLIQESLMELDEIIGINKVTAASTLSPEALKGTAEIMEQNTEVALDYLYRADEEITLDIYRSLGILVDQSVRYKTDDYWFRVLGEEGVKTLKKNRFVDYGYQVELRPTEAEWRDLYDKAEKALAADKIEFDDLLDLKAANNLKEARAMFKVKVRKYREEKQKSEQQKIEGTIKGQQMSNVEAHKNQVDLEKTKINGELALKQKDAELEMLKHKNKMAEIKLQVALMTNKSLREIDLQSDNKIEELIVQDRLYETSTNDKGNVEVRAKYKNDVKK